MAIKKIKPNDLGTIDIPLNQVYSLIIGRDDNFKKYKVVLEELIPTEGTFREADKTQEIILVPKRYEEFIMTKEELLKGIDDGNQYLVYNANGPQEYQLLKKESLLKR